MIDSAMFYIIGTLYPILARATYPALGLSRNIPARSAQARPTRTRRPPRKRPPQDAIAEPLHVLHSFYMRGKPFIGGDHPSIADIRLAATLEFLAVIDYPLPTWASKYIGDTEKMLGAAYSEPAGDVRGYIAYVKSQKK